MIDFGDPGATAEPAVGDHHADAIAVIGYAGRFPGAPDVEQYWRHLRDGTDVRTEFTDEELDEAGVAERVRARPGFVRAGYVLDGATDFDAGFFGMSPVEAALVDPQQRLFLECVWEAFEHAGHQPGGPVGVFAGEGLSGHLLTVLLAHRGADDLVGSYQALTANDKDFLATRVSYKLGLTGPSMVVQTACSTSLVAVHLAAQSLLAGECDLAVAGGVSVMLPQRAGYVHQPGMILSPDGRCRPFDAAAGGTVRGDGLGAVLLRRLGEAVAAGDTVHGVILGSAVNNDGSGKLGFSATSVERQRDVVVQAHEIAGVTADTVSYVEAHGTGTDLGDPAEVRALAQAFGRGPDRAAPAVLGSVKANVGHLDAAAGMAGLIKVLLMLRHREIPPLLHHTRPNPKLDLTHGLFEFTTEARRWTAPGGIRRAGITSLGIGGTNAHVVLEQPPEPPEPARSRPAQLLTLSARTPEALAEAAQRLAARLDAPDAPDLADAAYTTHVGRALFAHRRFVRCRSRGEAVRLLGAADAETIVSDGTEHRPVVFLFPGQGAQRVGMGRLLWEAEPVFRETAEEAARLFEARLGLDLRTVLHGPPGDDAEDLLRRTEVTQAALFTTEYALAKLFEDWGVRPAAMLGHSVGELVAACLAGVFDLPAAVELVAGRGRLMAGLPAGEMVSAAVSEAVATELAERYAVDVAAVNGVADCVFSGPPRAVRALCEVLDRDRVDHRRLRTAHAFHSAALDPFLAEFAELVRKAGPRPPRVPFVSGVTGTWITEAQAVDPEYWANQLRAPVRFHDGLVTLFDRPDAAVVEIGPGQALAALARRSPARESRPVLGTLGGLPRTTANEYEAVLEAVGRLWAVGADVDWEGLHRGERRTRVPLPAYPFQRSRHQLDVPASVTAERAPGELLYRPSWRRAEPVAGARGARRWLLIGDTGGSGDELAERLRAAGNQVDVVDPAAGYRELLRELRGSGRVPDAVALLGGGAADVRALAGAWHAEETGGDLWFVTGDVCRVESADVPDPRHAALPEAAALANREFDGLTCRVLDASRAAERVAAELTGPDPAPLTALRGPFRWLPAYEPVPNPPGEGFRTGATYVVTGDPGGLGGRIAAWLTERFGARVVPDVAAGEVHGVISVGGVGGVVDRFGEHAPEFHLVVRSSSGVLAPVNPVPGAVRSIVAGLPEEPADAEIAALDRAVALPSGAQVVIGEGDPARPRRRASRRQEPAAQSSATQPEAAPSVPRQPGNGLVAEMEAVVRVVWHEVLGVSDVDPDGNFFDLGGDSMTGLRVIRGLSERAGVRLDAVDVFEAPTVRALAHLLAERAGGADEAEPAARELTDEAKRAQRRRNALRRGGRTATGVGEGE